MALTPEEQKQGLRYFTVVEKVSQIYAYEVKATDRGEARQIVKEGRARAKSTSKGITTYEVFG